MKIGNDYSQMEKALEQLREGLAECHPDKKKNASAAILAAEEILLLYQDAGKYDEFDIDYKKTSKSLAVSIAIAGDPCSVKTLSSRSDFQIIANIAKNSDLEIDYVYRDGFNRITLTVERYHSLKDNFMFAFRYLRSDKALFIFGVAAQIVSIVANLCIPALTAKVVVAYTENAFYQALAAVLAILVANLVYHIFFSFTNIVYNKIDFRVKKNLEIDLVGAILTVKEECFDEKGTGPFISRVNSDIPIVAMGLQTVVDIVTQLSYFAGIFVATLVIDEWIFLCELVLVAGLAIIERVRGRNLQADKKAVYSFQEEESGLIVDIINGEKEIKHMEGERFFNDRISVCADEVRKKSERKELRSRCAIMTGSTFSDVCFFGIVVLLAYFLAIGRNSVADTVVLFNYITLIGAPFITIIQNLVNFIKDFDLSCERIRNLCEGSEFPKEEFGEVHLEAMAGKITLRNVSFAYNHNDLSEADKTVIHDVSLEIDPGETVALVGKSGCGKSTLLKLIAGERSCSSGCVMLDGVNIADLDKPTLRGNVMVVSQSPYMFNASIKENLLLAKPDATMDELREVCEMACILDDIEQMSEGFDTVLGESGTRISGGQRQRLAIARGLLRDSKIIIFDESTSAIDNITQAKIKRTIATLSGDHTVICVAHRLSTIIDADRIILIDDGRVIAQGTHEELLGSSAQYRELYSENG